MPTKDEPRITIRVSTETHERLTTRAKELGISVGALVRSSVEVSGEGIGPVKDGRTQIARIEDVHPAERFRRGSGSIDAKAGVQPIPKPGS